MTDILTQIANHVRMRVMVAKQTVTPEMMQSCALDKNLDTGFPFERALAGEGLSFICECKKASPSKGLIAADYDPLRIAREYRRAGADALSILTEPNWFRGSEDHLQEVATRVKLPSLRKDVVVDDYMIYEAKTLGASAVLLIVALLDEKTLRAYIEVCDRLGLSALVEAHDAEEIRKAASAGARLVGVNNRNLRDFSVDLTNAAALRKAIPKDVLFVAESGVKTPDDAAALREAGADALLVGEAMMRASDKTAFLAALRRAAEE